MNMIQLDFLKEATELKDFYRLDTLVVAQFNYGALDCPPS